MIQSRRFLVWTSNAAIALLTAGQFAAADQHNFYVAVDQRDEIHFGDYLGLPNPNLGRLTFLYGHWDDDDPESNHFHGIGVHFYEGEVGMEIPTTTNGNNRIPETYTGQAPLTLTPGVGGQQGRFVSGETDEHYSDLTLYPVDDLAGYPETAPETYMYNSSAMGYQGPLAGMDLAIEVVSMTPGLFLGDEGLSAPGEQLVIGGEADLPFAPLFWTEDTASPGTYSAEFQLVDRSGTYLESGTINLDFAVVPEPSSIALLCAAACGIAIRGRMA